MAKLNQGLDIHHSFQFIWQNVCGYLKTTDVSTSTFFYIKKTIINQIINQVLIDYESLGCLLLFYLIMSFNCLSDNFYACMATVLDKMC